MTGHVDSYGGTAVFMNTDGMDAMDPCMQFVAPKGAGKTEANRTGINSKTSAFSMPSIKGTLLSCDSQMTRNGKPFLSLCVAVVGGVTNSKTGKIPIKRLLKNKDDPSLGKQPPKIPGALRAPKPGGTMMVTAWDPSNVKKLPMGATVELGNVQFEIVKRAEKAKRAPVDDDADGFADDAPVVADGADGDDTNNCPDWILARDGHYVVFSCTNARVVEAPPATDDLFARLDRLCGNNVAPLEFGALDPAYARLLANTTLVSTVPDVTEDTPPGTRRAHNNAYSQLLVTPDNMVVSLKDGGDGLAQVDLRNVPYVHRDSGTSVAVSGRFFPSVLSQMFLVPSFTGMTRGGEAYPRTRTQGVDRQSSLGLLLLQIMPWCVPIGTNSGTLTHPENAPAAAFDATPKQRLTYSLNGNLSCFTGPSVPPKEIACVPTDMLPLGATAYGVELTFDELLKMFFDGDHAKFVEGDPTREPITDAQSSRAYSFAGNILTPLEMTPDERGQLFKKSVAGHMWTFFVIPNVSNPSCVSGAEGQDKWSPAELAYRTSPLATARVCMKLSELTEYEHKRAALANENPNIVLSTNQYLVYAVETELATKCKAAVATMRAGLHRFGLKSLVDRTHKATAAKSSAAAAAPTPTTSSNAMGDTGAVSSATALVDNRSLASAGQNNAADDDDNDNDNDNDYDAGDMPSPVAMEAAAVKCETSSVAGSKAGGAAEFTDSEGEGETPSKKRTKTSAKGGSSKKRK